MIKLRVINKDIREYLWCNWAIYESKMWWHGNILMISRISGGTNSFQIRFETAFSCSLRVPISPAKTTVQFKYRFRCNFTLGTIMARQLWDVTQRTDTPTPICDLTWYKIFYRCPYSIFQRWKKMPVTVFFVKKLRIQIAKNFILASKPRQNCVIKRLYQFIKEIYIETTYST